jgi:hypothetical protein
MGFGETQILLVEPGTVVGTKDDGTPAIVTDEAAVFKGDRMWVTKKIFDAMIDRTKQWRP